MIFNYIPKKGDMFVTLGVPYEEITFTQAVQDQDDLHTVCGVSPNKILPGKEPGFTRAKLNELPGPFFPIFSPYAEPRPELLPYFELCKPIRKIVDDFLFDRPQYKAKISDVESHIMKFNYSLEEAQAVLKSNLANGITYKYSRNESQNIIGFSDMKAKQHNQIKYYNSIASELKIKSDKISLLVSHGQTVGNYREVILRNMIKQHLPEKFGIGTGFMQGFSRQLDIIIYDTLNYSPSFREGDLIVVKQEAVRAIIEVKTTLTSKTLFEALDMFYEISLPGYKSTALPIFKGIYSFESKFRNTSAVAKSIHNFYTKPYFNEHIQKNMTRDILYLYHEITSVATLNKHCILTKYSSKSGGGGNVIPKLLSIDSEKGMDIHSAAFISTLFEYLDVEPYAKKDSVWRVLNLVDLSARIKHETNLTSDDWFPRIRKENEPKGDQESIKNRTDSFNSWFYGDISTSSLLKNLMGNSENIKG